MRIRVIAASVAVLICCGMLLNGRGTFAAWNDSAGMTDATISSGDLVMTVGNQATSSHDFEFAALSTAALGPGGSNSAPLTVQNAGNIPMSFSLVSARTTGGLAGDLHARVDAVAADSDCPVAGTASAHSVYNGPVTDISASRPIDVPVGGRQILCFRISLPADADQSLADESSQVTFVLRAESRSGAA